ncbi:MAG: nicotinate-nucleotide adenylyltransferase [Muribaculaceae bacterium]|nr:nicotinate-nucleotide adenylyltransferase [Muribaculaceae bacterium]
MTTPGKTIGILGGSFNPVHIGHVMLASYLTQFTSLDSVWLTLSPLNPLKANSSELIPDVQRLNMLAIATKNAPGIEICDIELSMPRPSYTINTLDFLCKKYPGRQFKLIIGSDNWKIFEQWRDYRRIIDQYGVIVYPRPGYPLPSLYEDGVDVIDAPVFNISSTFIRRAVAKGFDMTFFLPSGVFDYIKKNRLYGYNEPFINE